MPAQTFHSSYDLRYQDASDERGPDGPFLYKTFRSEAEMRAWAEARYIVPLDYYYRSGSWEGRDVRQQLDY